ncbi:MAG: hypothetical protein D0530_00735 [Methylococcales bacterium]|nr:MAG: hypothetical protein D0530_00735 [Methylococcales bacterium]
MKNKVKCLAAVGLLSLALPYSKVMADDQKVAVDLTTNIIISPGYHDFVQSHFSSTTGIGGWYGVGAGVKFNLNEQTSITPGVDFLINQLEINYYGYYSSTGTYTNTIFLPKVVGRYQFQPKSPSPFIEAELNYNLPSSDWFDFKSGGIGYGGTLGYQFSPALRIQCGYEYIPVKTGYINTDSVNMGGFVAKAGFSF